MRKTFIIMAMVVALAISTMATAIAQGQSTNGNAANSLGKTTLDTDVSSWDVGTGQFNGEFITAENQGVVIGLRAKERFEGPGLLAGGTNGNRVGVYEAATGDTGGNNGTWNYDWHVDLSGTDRTLSEYKLALEQDYSDENLFGLGAGTVVLAWSDGNVCTDNYGGDTPPGEVGVDLCQGSWNPGFGNDDFQPNAEGTYNLRLVLTPETFNGPPLAVKIQVNVS